MFFSCSFITPISRRSIVRIHRVRVDITEFIIIVNAKGGEGNIVGHVKSVKHNFFPRGRLWTQHTKYLFYLTVDLLISS